MVNKAQSAHVVDESCARRTSVERGRRRLEMASVSWQQQARRVRQRCQKQTTRYIASSPHRSLRGKRERTPLSGGDVWRCTMEDRTRGKPKAAYAETDKVAHHGEAPERVLANHRTEEGNRWIARVSGIQLEPAGQEQRESRRGRVGGERVERQVATNRSKKWEGR